MCQVEFLLISKTCVRIQYKAISLTYNTRRSSHLSYLNQLFTFTFNAFLFRPNTAPPFFHLGTKICLSLHSLICPISVEQTPASITTTIYERIHIRTYTYELTKISPLAIPQFFTPNWKHCSSKNPVLIHPLLPPSLPVSIPNTIHLGRLYVCLPNSLDLWPLTYRLLDKRLWISWFPRLRSCERGRNLEFTITLTIRIFTIGYFKYRPLCGTVHPSIHWSVGLTLVVVQCPLTSSLGKFLDY